MTEIISVKTRYEYDPYKDLHRLFQLAGFPSCYVDEVDVSRPVVYIVAPMNGEWRPHISNQDSKQRNAHMILWNIERPSGSAGSIGKYGQDNRDLLYRRFVDEVWVSDRRLAAETTLRFVPLGSHPDFGTPGTTKRYTFTHQSYEIPRRRTISDAFRPDQIGPNCWPPQRDEVLQQSRFGIALHQDHFPFLEPLRLAVFAAYALPTLAETVYDPYPYGGDTMAFSDYDMFAPTLRKMIADDYAHWSHLGARMRQLMTVEFEFGKVVREAIEQSVGDWR